MRATGCDREPEVLRALSAGTWPDTLHEHVTGCPSCSETLTVAQAMRSASRDASPTPLPDPGRIWRTAQRELRTAAAERATGPIRVMWRVAAAVGVAAAGATVVWSWPAVAPRLGASLTALTHRGAIDGGQVLTAALGFASLAVFVAVFAAFEAWARD